MRDSVEEERHRVRPDHRHLASSPSTCDSRSRISRWMPASRCPAEAWPSRRPTGAGAKRGVGRHQPESVTNEKHTISHTSRHERDGQGPVSDVLTGLV